MPVNEIGIGQQGARSLNWKHSTRPYRGCERGAMHSQNKLTAEWEVIVKSQNLSSSLHALLENLYLSVIALSWKIIRRVYFQRRMMASRIIDGYVCIYFILFFKSRGHALRFIGCDLMLCFSAPRLLKVRSQTLTDHKNGHCWGEIGLSVWW